MARGGTVSLPMYDMPEVREHTRKLMEVLARAGNGVCYEHDLSLTQQATSDLLWDDHAHMAVSQMCGLALYDRQKAGSSPLRRLGTPVYNAEGCSPGTYCAWIVVHANLVAEGACSSLADLAGARVAINHHYSYSGTVGLCAAVARLFGAAPSLPSPIIFFDPIAVTTGSHRSSLAAC